MHAHPSQASRPCPGTAAARATDPLVTEHHAHVHHEPCAAGTGYRQFKADQEWLPLRHPCYTGLLADGIDRLTPRARIAWGFKWWSTRHFSHADNHVGT